MFFIFICVCVYICIYVFISLQLYHVTAECQEFLTISQTAVHFTINVKENQLFQK